MIKFYDNKGKTADRYGMAVKVGKQWDIYAFSDDPQSPQGVNSFCGTYEMDSNVNLEIDWDDVPERVQKAILDRLAPIPY